jgi:hypothetical protein
MDVQVERPEVEGVLRDLDAVFGGMKGKAKEELEAKLKEEALQPTRDAIQVRFLNTCQVLTRHGQGMRFNFPFFPVRSFIQYKLLCRPGEPPSL